MQIDYKWKIAVVGDGSVGKTTLMLQYTEKKFHELYIPTVGVQVSLKTVPVKTGKEKGKMRAELAIWDIAGQSKFEQIRKIFYEGASAYLILYDITKQNTFDSISYWINDIAWVIGDKYGILIGNKKDLAKYRVISEDQGKELAAEYHLDFMETSAKTGENVNNVFELITKKLFELYGT
jgi:small GTP-binding protein